MLDLKLLRESPETLLNALKKRDSALNLDSAIQLDRARRAAIQLLDELKHTKNVASEEISQLKAQGKPVDDKIAKMRVSSQKEREIEKEVGELSRKLENILVNIPNIPHESVPVGGASANSIVRSWGDVVPGQGAKTHIELGERLEIIDLPRAAKITGAHFTLLRGWGARLERALYTFMLDVHTQEHGYTEVAPPYLVNRDSMFSTGQVPKFEDDMYALKDDPFFLIPTAEVPVTNMHRNEILAGETLPIKYTAYTPCFRREAGSYGKDTKGLVRVHQFDKVEMVQLTTPEASYDTLETLVQQAETVLQRLELAYRVVLLSTGDLSFSAAKCYDIEVWSPGVGQFLECSSCSNFEDFQSRRANIRYKSVDGTKGFVHTLNGSGVALARTLVALLETHQQPDGSIRIPQALQPYAGTDRIT
jgi:seryl-tRNA synthetase